jgi:hypothetical protein
MARKQRDEPEDVNGARMPEPVLPLFAEAREYTAEATERLAQLTPLQEFIARGLKAQAELDSIMTGLRAQAVERLSTASGQPVSADEDGTLHVGKADDPTSIEIGREARDAHAAKRKAKVAALVPLARELARETGEGITVSDLRRYALERGLLTGTEKGRELSYLGVVMKAAGLISDGSFRRSDIASAHGVANLIWRRVAT